MDVVTNEMVALLKLVVCALVNAYVAGGSKHAILPSDSKIKIIGLLTQMMVDPALAATYCQALEWEVNQRGSTVETAWLHRIGLEIREEEIAARGFVGLTDDELADIALSPAAIQALADDFINDPDTKLGAWYVEALSKKGQASVE